MRAIGTTRWEILSHLYHRLYRVVLHLSSRSQNVLALMVEVVRKTPTDLAPRGPADLAVFQWADVVRSRVTVKPTCQPDNGQRSERQVLPFTNPNRRLSLALPPLSMKRLLFILESLPKSFPKVILCYGFSLKTSAASRKNSSQKTRRLRRNFRRKRNIRRC